MKNYAEFEIKGLNQERFFNEFSSNLKIFDLLRINNSTSRFKVSYFSYKKAKSIILESGFEILSEKKAGFFHKVISKFFSYGLVLGIVLGFAFCITTNLFVKKIEVWGNEKVEDYQIVSFLKESVKDWRKNRIDVKEIEKHVYDHFSCFSFVSVAVYGQTLIVNVKEEIIPEEMAEKFDAIYSKYDGIITDISLVQGTLCVHVGDIVKKGQKLVEPFVTGSNGQVIPIKPQADIMADIWIVEQECHNCSYEAIFQTGNKITVNEIYLGNLKIYEKKMENLYENFEIEEYEEILNKNNILPLKLKTITYYETEKKQIEEPFEEVQEQICEKTKQKALQKVEDYDIIKKEKQSIKTVGNLTFVSYTITVNKNIGE